MDEFGLMMFEQPLAHDDMLDHAKLQREIQTPICLDESIKSPDDARKAIEINAGRIVNVKLGRVGGHSQAQQVETACRQAGIPVWCGGMLESGVGRAHNIAMSTLAAFLCPGRLCLKALLARGHRRPACRGHVSGNYHPAERPGMGFDVDRGRIKHISVKTKHIGKSCPEISEKTRKKSLIF
jgi:O-succinylbenzoate synthase